MLTIKIEDVREAPSKPNNIYTMHGCLFIGLYVSAIKVKTAELIGPKLCVSVEPHMTPGKV